MLMVCVVNMQSSEKIDPQMIILPDLIEVKVVVGVYHIFILL